jgi:hypothetical protein
MRTKRTVTFGGIENLALKGAGSNRCLDEIWFWHLYDG